MKKTLGRILIVAGAAYVLASTWLYRSQRRLLYLPQPLSATPKADSFHIESQGLRRQGWVVNPGQKRALLYFGGNAEPVEQVDDFFRNTLPRTSVYLIPYRGYSGNPGSPSEAALFADALEGYDHVAARHANVAVMGRSLGSGVAIYVAVNRPVTRLVLTTPYDSIQNVAQKKYPIFPMRWILADKYESWRRAPAIQAKTLILVATDDKVISRASTDNLIARMKIQPDVVVIEKADHRSITTRVEYAEAIREFLGDPPAA